MKNIPLLFAALLLAPLFAHAQVELVYKTPTETLPVAGIQGLLPLYQSGGQRVPVPGGGQLEIRPAKDFSPIQATVSLFYSVRRAPRESDGTSRVTVTYVQTVVPAGGTDLKRGGYVAGAWEVAGKPVRVFAYEVAERASVTDTLALKPGEEDGVLRMYFFYDGKSIEGLTAKDVKPSSALSDFVALKSAIDATSRQEVVAWAETHPQLVVPTPFLCQLAQWGDVAALEAILTQPATHKNLSAREGGDVLMAAVRSNRPGATALILKSGVKASQPGTTDMVPMQQATAINSPDMVRQLLEAGATVDDQTFQKDATPLSLAVKQGSAEVVEALLAAGAQWPKPKWLLTKWLTISVEQRCAANVVRLLAQGADANAIKGEYTSGGMSLLAMAALGNNVEIIDALLKAGARPNTENEEGLSALMISAYAGNQTAVERLLAAGAAPGHLDRASQSAAGWALVGGNENLTRLLLRRYAPTKADLASLLKLALLNEKTRLADELRAKGAQLDLSDKQIDDVVCDAIRKGDIATVREVLAAGYDANKQIRSDWTAGGVAQRYGQGEILDTLKTSAHGTLAVKIPAVSKLPVRLTHRTPVSTPEELQAAGIYGEAKIDLMIDAEGYPAFPRILPGCDPQLGRQALISMMQWTFDPLQNNSKAWRRVIIPLRFTKPGAADREGSHIFYPWELEQPAMAMDRKVESWEFVSTEPVAIVVPTFIVNRQGEVMYPRIASSSSPDFKAQVLADVRDWKYQPGAKDGRLVWSYQRGYVVMPGLRRIQPQLLYPLHDLSPGAVAPRILKEGSTQEYGSEFHYKPLYFGVVLLRFTVGADGKVRTASPLATSNERVTQYAENVCLSTIYEPGKIDGKPVAMEVIQCMSFVDYEDSFEQIWNLE